MPLPDEVTKDWPAELKSDPSLKDFKDVASLARSHIETKALVGASLRIPGKDAGPEAQKVFAASVAEKVPGIIYLPDDPAAREMAVKDAWKKLGRPDDAKAYSVEGVQLEPGVVFTEADVEAMRAAAVKRGYTKDQFRSLAKELSEARALAMKGEKDNRAALQRELGAAFEERTLAASLSAEKRGFTEDVVRALRNGSVDLKTFKAFDAVARGFGETRQVAGQDGGAGGKPTPAEARTQRAELMARPEYFQPSRAQMGVHETLVAKVQELNALIDAGG